MFKRDFRKVKSRFFCFYTLRHSFKEASLLNLPSIFQPPTNQKNDYLCQKLYKKCNSQTNMSHIKVINATVITII